MEHRLRLRLSASHSDSRLRPPGSPFSAGPAHESGSSGSDTDAGSDDDRLEVQVGSGSRLARRSVSRLGPGDAPAMRTPSQPRSPRQAGAALTATMAATTVAATTTATAAPPQRLSQRHTRPLSFPECIVLGTLVAGGAATLALQRVPRPSEQASEADHAHDATLRGMVMLTTLAAGAAWGALAHGNRTLGAAREWARSLVVRAGHAVGL